MTSILAADRALKPLIRLEIGNYLRSKVFWVGAALWALLCARALAGGAEDDSTTADGIMVAAALGLLGIEVMAGLVRNSDRAAAAAGTVAVPQRTRTLALAAATVVPGAMALIWFGCAMIGFHITNPPEPYAAPFAPFTAWHWNGDTFAEGVVPCVGGPMLGLVIGRWLPHRGAAPAISVVVVVISMILQPLVTWAEQVRLAWVWVHFVGPGSVIHGSDRLWVYPGSPWVFSAYQASLCWMGLLVAVYRDPDCDRKRMQRQILAAVAVSAVLIALTWLVGPHHEVPSPVPAPTEQA